jgi:hypothetical protein
LLAGVFWPPDPRPGAHGRVRRLGIDLLRLGDFHIVAAAAVSWIGIGFVSIVSILGPTKRSAGQ